MHDGAQDLPSGLIFTYTSCVLDFLFFLFLEDVILYAYTGKVLLYCVKAFVTTLTFLPRTKYIRSRSWDSTCNYIYYWYIIHCCCKGYITGCTKER